MKMRSWNSGSFAFTTDQNKSRGNGNIFETERGRPENNKKKTGKGFKQLHKLQHTTGLLVLIGGWLCWLLDGC
jgi:hypothetical protein